MEPSESSDQHARATERAEGRIWVVGVDSSAGAGRALTWAINRAAAAKGNGHEIHIKAVSAWSVPVDSSIGLAGAGPRIDSNTDGECQHSKNSSSAR